MSRPAPTAATGSEDAAVAATPLTALRALLEDAPSGFGLPSAERDGIDAACGKGAAIYGELEDDGALRLLRCLDLGPSDVFIDLGSGTGRIPLLAVCATSVGEAIGVELALHRHRSAVDLRDALLARRPAAERANLANRIRLLHDDLRTIDLSTVTVAYAGATCFPDSLVTTLCRRLRSAAPRLRRLILTRPPPPPYDRVFPPVAELDLPASWSPRVRVHLHGAP